MKLGEYNDLKVARFVDFGAYLSDEDGNEVLLPAKYINRDAGVEIGSTLSVFVYNDSMDRPVATTQIPLATVGQLAFLSVTAVNDIGAFLDWGLEKNLLVPFREQKVRMRKGGEYLVYVYLDHASQRIVASAKYEKFIDNVFPDYEVGAPVDAMIVSRSDLGYKVVVDNRFSGMIYENDVFRDLEPGDSVKGYVKKVRDDGKLDITIRERQKGRVAVVAQEIIERLRRSGGYAEIGDFSTPDYIRASFNCSKKDFKIAIGNLMKAGKIAKTEKGLELLDSK